MNKAGVFATPMPVNKNLLWLFDIDGKKCPKSLRSASQGLRCADLVMHDHDPKTWVDFLPTSKPA